MYTFLADSTRLIMLLCSCRCLATEKTEPDLHVQYLMVDIPFFGELTSSRIEPQFFLTHSKVKRECPPTTNHTKKRKKVILATPILSLSPKTRTHHPPDLSSHSVDISPLSTMESVLNSYHPPIDW